MTLADNKTELLTVDGNDDGKSGDGKGEELADIDTLSDHQSDASPALDALLDRQDKYDDIEKLFEQHAE